MAIQMSESRDYDRAIEILRRINHPLTDFEVASDRQMWIRATADFLVNYHGDFAFLVDMKRNILGVNPRGLTLGQVRGVANCMRAHVIKAQREIEAAAKPVETPKVAPVEITKEIPDGYYTVAFEGGHRTFRVNTDDRATWVAFLSGSNNESDYTGFARIIGGKLVPFKKWNADTVILDCAKVLFTDDLTKLGQAYAKASGRCWVCNRTLTTPESIEAGIGPVCQSKRFGG